MVRDSFVGEFLGENIVFAEGEQWKAQRHVINPAFYNIELFYQPFEDLVNKCLDKWAMTVKDSKKGKAPINVPNDMTNMTIDILGRTIFGYDFGALDDKLDNYVESYMFLMSSLGNIIRMFLPFLNKLPTKYNQDMRYHLTRFDEMMYKLINDRKKEIAERPEDYTGEKTLLDLMIESQKVDNGTVFTDKHLRDNLVIFFVCFTIVIDIN
jgi:cytochrome P450